MEFQPIFLAMFVFTFFVKIIPRVISKPTGIDLVDKVVMLTVSIQDSVLPGSILVALVVMTSTYIDNQLV